MTFSAMNYMQRQYVWMDALWWSGKKTQAVSLSDVVLHEDPQEVESQLSVLYHLCGVLVTGHFHLYVNPKGSQ